MDIWIRSQDREELIKVNNIYITTCNEGWAIRSGDVLGKYRTQERAKEILDEISELIKQRLIIKVKNKVPADCIKTLTHHFKTDLITNEDADIKGLDNGCIVYELPEE